MEAREMYLYKVSQKSYSCPCYVAGENQQQAVEKVKGEFSVDARELTVEYVDMVTV
jgi:hypothetical protein